MQDMKNANKGRMLSHLFTIYLMYLDSPDKQQIKDLAVNLKKTYYLTDEKKEHLEYLSSLPSFVPTKEVFSDEEYKLFELSGVNIDKAADISEIHAFLIEKLKKNKLLAMYELIKNKESYIYWYTIILSRSFKISLQDFEVLYDLKFIDRPQGRKHLEMILSLTSGKFII